VLGSCLRVRRGARLLEGVEKRERLERVCEDGRGTGYVDWHGGFWGNLIVLLISTAPVANAIFIGRCLRGATVMRVRVAATSLRRLSYLISVSTRTACNWNLTPVPVNIFAIPGKDIS